MKIPKDGGLFPEWYAARVAVPGAVAGLPQRIQTMHKMYGAAEGKQFCSGCEFFIRHKPSKTSYFKCTLTEMTHGAGTDWRANWPACGKFKTKETNDEK